VFPTVSVERLEVHEVAGSSADVTEGTPVGPFGVNRERWRYDWSQRWLSDSCQREIWSGDQVDVSSALRKGVTTKVIRAGPAGAAIGR
jgi:hypothetical protein